MMRDEFETEEYRVVSIRGSPNSAQEAEILIQTLVVEIHLEIATVSIPSWTVGRIVGSNSVVIWRIGRRLDVRWRWRIMGGIVSI